MRGVFGLLLIVGGVVLAVLILTGRLSVPSLVIPRGSMPESPGRTPDPGPVIASAGSSSGGQQT